MKKTILFAVFCLAVLSAGCLPQQQLTGRVMDASGPVPGAAVLAMVWIEDAGKAFPAPIVEPLSQEQVTTLYEIDKAHRGLPAAYARAFTDKDGFFTLDKLYFSNETGKAVKAMSRPEITRITLVAFQRGHIKHAATVFPKGLPKELPPAVIILPRPEGWKQLALDNYFRMLKQPEYENGYSKDFGATKEEKKWFLDYVSSNLNEAYQASNIKGDKQWEKDCGRDFSDIMVSTAGIQRNPAHERCNELLHQAGVLRNWEESWLAHSLAIKTEPAPAVKAIGEALEALGPEYAEVRQYEAQIMEGAKEAGELDSKNEASGNPRNGLSEESQFPVEAQKLYSSGDKGGAYKALGYSLYYALPGDLKQGMVTAALVANVIPKIRETAGGFYLLMNRPLTAQLPNSDGNHKDKPGYKVEVTTEAAKPQEQTKKENRIEVETDKDGVPLKVKFVSPEGKTIKTMPPDKTIVAKSGKRLIHQAGYRESSDYVYAEYERESINAKGESTWHKSWKNYPKNGVDPEAGWSGWFEGIADNGERSYVTYRSSDGVYNLVVLDAAGREVGGTKYPEMLSGIEISPDGKIVGAEVYLPAGEKSIKHLFFFDVDAGRTKLVRAENTAGYGRSSLHTLIETAHGYQPLKARQITIYWLATEGASKDKVVTFDSLPEDAYQLFSERLEK